MGSRNRTRTASSVLPTYPAAEVWAVTTYTPECHDDDCYCGYDAEGTTVVALFVSEQTATQFADRKNGGHEHGPYSARKLPVHTAMRDLY